MSPPVASTAPQPYNSGSHGRSYATASGPILGCPVLGAEIELHDLRVGHGTSLSIITACVAQCIYQALGRASPVLLEPVMNLEITVDKTKMGVVLSDLAQRRSQILEVNAKLNTSIIAARTPLAELRNYSTALRTMTSGLASFSMQLAHYEQMSKEDERKTVKSITGLG